MQTVHRLLTLIALAVTAWYAVAYPLAHILQPFGFSLPSGLALLAFIAYLLVGPYGVAVRAQYAWGQKGYWQFPLTWELARLLLVGILPPWVLFALLAAAGCKGIQCMHQRRFSTQKFAPLSDPRGPVVSCLSRKMTAPALW